MKKYILFFFALTFAFNLSAQANDPVLMTVNGDPVKKSEFEYIYNKNSSTDKKNVEEYALLFADLKLKVAEAKTHGLDTTKTFRKEFRAYRNQAARPYLIDKKVVDKLVLDSYNRLKEELNVSYILVKITNGDSLAAYNKALAIKKRLEKEDFATVAYEVSDDLPSASRGGNIGYVTAFQTILPFENAIYSLPVGKVSDPVLNFFGYNIIKVNAKRPSQGSVHVAHIMITLPERSNDEDDAQAKQAIDSIYSQLKAGEDFATLAKKMSEHSDSAIKGGELSWFSLRQSGAGPNFEDAAFALKNPGDYSEPIRSWYGYHIIKLIDRKPLGTLAENRSEIIRKLQTDERAALPVQSFKEELRAEYNLQIIQSSVNEIKNIAGDSQKADSAFVKKTEKLNNPLFSFAGIVYNQKQYIDYLKKYPNMTLDIDRSLDRFIDSKLYEYEDTQLESKYPEFKLLMQEYYDGMLMFEISSKEVWERAADDTLGLKQYFANNRQNYTWDTPRFKGTIVFCKDKKTEKKAKKIIDSAPADSIPFYLNKALNTSNNKLVKTEKGLFIKGENKAVDKYAFSTGSYTPSSEYPIAFVAKGSKILSDGPEDYEDMKGIVVADYQNYLQEQWLETLRKKYKVVIYEDVLGLVAQ
jgi:peptidyl-prolyl cis-trans isomerase SurA